MADQPESAENTRVCRHRRQIGREALAIGLACAVGIVVLFWWATRPLPRVSRQAVLSRGDHVADSVGSRSCGECHPGISAAHHNSGHARTFRPAGHHSLAAWLDGRSAADPGRVGVTWAYRLLGESIVADRAEGGRVDSQQLEFALGSGRHAVSWITLLENEPDHLRIREHRLTYFAHDDELGLTPGHNEPYPGAVTHGSGRDFPADLSRKCIECHVTRISSSNTGRFDPATATFNVSCERCHGPAGAHVQAARRGATELVMPFGPDRTTAEEQMRLCGDCHRHPDVIPKDLLRSDNPSLARFQPVGLMQSACYRRGDGSLRCTTCHDPHARTSQDRAGYETACRTCHGGDTPGHPSCPVADQGGCIDCHMPSVEVTRGMRFADHWIRVPGESSPGRPRPISSATSRPRPASRR